jgi:hypothetical protein
VENIEGMRMEIITLLHCLNGHSTLDVVKILILYAVLFREANFTVPFKYQKF